MIKVYISINVRMRKVLVYLYVLMKIWYREGVRDSFCECYLNLYKIDMN